MHMRAYAQIASEANSHKNKQRNGTSLPSKNTPLAIAVEGWGCTNVRAVDAVHWQDTPCPSKVENSLAGGQRLTTELLSRGGQNLLSGAL